MQHFKFDLKVQLVLIAVRKHKGLKQSTMSVPLNLDRTSYSRIENGKAALSFGRLQAIAEELEITTEIISILANSFEIDDFEIKSVDEILNCFISSDNSLRGKINFSDSELYAIFSTIKRFCPKIVHLGKSYKAI